MESLTGFLNNATLMIVLCVIYDIFRIYAISNKNLKDSLTGVLVGLICIAVMLTPWSLQPGVFFDTRWVLLSLCGLYFGLIPTLIAVVIAGVFRLYQGGPGGIVGTVVIVVTALVGVAWKYWKDRCNKPLTWIHLYVFGVAVQLAMLSCMFLMPANIRGSIFKNIALPILLIYPVLTTIIGLILRRQEERRSADKALTYSTSLATAALESTPDGVMIVDCEGKIARWNQKYVDLWHVPVELLKPPFEVAPLLAHIVAQMANPEEYLAKTNELHNHPEESSTDTLYLADGRVFDRYSQPQKIGNEIVGRFWSFRDITERKLAENELAQQKALFEAIVNCIPDAIVYANVDREVVRINPAFSSIFGFTIDELEGKKTSFFYESLEEYERQGMLRFNLTTVERALPYEVSYRKKGGPIFPGETLGTVVKGVDGSKMGYIGVIRDITERKQAEREKQKLELQFQHTQKLESLGVLAGGIAHDFNNILASIIGNADLALMRINPESAAIDNLHNIEIASARAADLAKQMLAYSGKGRFTISNHDINGLLEEMLHILQVSISKKAVLRLNLTRPLPSIEADATQIRQIIMNLVINASEAIGDKSGVIAITTGCMDCDRSYLKDVWLDENLIDGLYVFIEITDTGCGMDKEILAKLFDPFFTTKFTGRGLGMAAVLGIVRGHKGAVKVYSEPGKGSTFKILLPASCKPAEIFNLGPQNDHWRGSGTVLLVDDEETIRGVGAEMLKELGFNVVTANDGREAIEVYKARTDISFVILDLTMPHMDGEQCFRELRLLNPDVKVILSSGFSELEVTQKFVGKGLAGFIQKPYKLSVLCEGVMEMVP